MTERLVSAASLAGRLEEAMSIGSCSGAQLVTVTVPAPIANPTHVFALHVDAPAHYLASGDRGGDVGLGAAVMLNPESVTDLAAVEVQAQSLLEHAFELGIDASARSPRFYGGIAFEPRPLSAGPWGSFGQFGFVLPRFRYTTDGQRASLTLHALATEVASPSDRQSWIGEVNRLLSDLTSLQPATPLPAVRLRREQPRAEHWLEQVHRVLSAMQQGPLEKVVLARQVTFEFDDTPSIPTILDNLNLLSPETTRFAFRRGRSVFLGATPERLILRLGSELRTEAVAGSVRAQDTDGATQLMESEKERHEHDLVVREVVRKLEQMGARTEARSRPTIRQLRHVLHLATTITARIFGPPHILTLVSRLHPTPAVGGVPDELALECMREHEDFERGWYAAPIGWFDGQGDGEFVVGLRSGLLTDKLLRLYAGAGIVKNSQPEKELQETELKLQNMLDAVGATEVGWATLGRSEPLVDAQ